MSIPNTSHKRYSPARRKLLQHAAAAGLSLLAPACSRTEQVQPAAQRHPIFAGGALRLDWRQRLAAGAENFTLERMRFERNWPERWRILTDGPDWGDYRLSVYDPASEALLYRQGFDTGISAGALAATTQLSVRFPMPQRPVRAVIEKRRAERTFVALSTVAIDPQDSAIERAPGAIATRVDVIDAGGEPGAKVNLAILGDGYRQAEYAKFADDARRAASYLLLPVFVNLLELGRRKNCSITLKLIEAIRCCLLSMMPSTDGS